MEPPRLYPLRSSNTGELNHQKNIGNSGDKWVKTPFTNGEPVAVRKVVTGTNKTMIDSYRPNGSARTTTGRGVPGIIDSYHPGDSGRSTIHEARPASTTPLNCPIGLNNSGNSVVQSPTPVPLGPLDRPLSLDHSKGLPATTIPGYMPLEKVMEKKAIALNMRRPFFQYLQKIRDQVRSEHPECKTEYRHWAADSLVWKKFCTYNLP